MYSPLGQRNPLPPRRRSEARRIEWISPLNPDGWPQKIYVTIGYDEADALTPREIFYDAGYKSGSDMETLLRDLCIVLSVLLQHDGVELDLFMSSISREVNIRTDQAEMGSIVGVLIKELNTPPQWAGEIAAALKLGKGGRCDV
jgi:hypothetical protein